MLKKGFISFVFVLLITFYSETKIESRDTEPYDQVVSLGFGCQVAFQLEHNGYRSLAYPFDWFNTPFESLIAFISNEGKNFLDADKISVVGPYPGDTLHLEVMDSLYGIVSYHDFLSWPYLGNYHEIKAKYDRRVKRFFDLLNSNNRVLFVRQGLSKAQVEYLDYLLHSSYPNLSYTLIAINNTEEYKSPWELFRIENFYAEPGWDWRGDYASWTKILIQFTTVNFTNRSDEERW